MLLLFISGSLRMKPDQVSGHMNDYREYWGAARLTLDGKNPYSPEFMFEIPLE